jgi:hypothetical protein
MENNFQPLMWNRRCRIPIHGDINTREQTLERWSSAETEVKTKGGRPLRTAKKEESGARVRSLDLSFLRSFAAMQIFVKTREFLNRGSLKSGVCFWILVIHCCWSCVFVSASSLSWPAGVAWILFACASSALRILLRFLWLRCCYIWGIYLVFSQLVCNKEYVT